MLKYLIIIIILLESEINSFSRNISNYCNSFESECKGDYSSNGVYSTKCQKLCNKEYRFKCDYDLCASKKESCEIISKKTRLFGLMHFSLQTKIKRCQFKSYQISKNDFCINPMDFLKKKYSFSVSGFVLSKKSKVCQCKGNHIYECGQSVCTKSDNLLNKNKLNGLKNH